MRTRLPIALACLLFVAVPTAARADISVGAFVTGGFSPEADGGDWGIGGHIGWELGDFLMLGVDGRYNQVPWGVGGVHNAPNFTGTVRLRLPIWMVQPYIAVRAGFGLWYGAITRNEHIAGLLAGDAGVFIALGDSFRLKLGVDISTFNGDFRVERIWLANGVAGIDINF